MGSRVKPFLVATAVCLTMVGCGDSGVGNGDTSAALEDVKKNMSTKDTPENPTPPKRLPDGVPNAGGGRPGKFAGTGAGK